MAIRAGDRKKFDLTFDLAIVTLRLQIFPGLILGNSKVYATSWCDDCDLNLTCNLVIVTMSSKILSGLFPRFSKV